jgi:hypothetical protein
VKSCLYQSLRKIWLSNDNSDSDQNCGQQEGSNVDCDPTFEASCSSYEPQGGFNDLVRGFYFVNKKKLNSISRLHGWNLLHQDNEIRFFRNRQNEFKEFFSQENDLVFSNEFCSVIEALGHQHDPNEWRLFGSSKVGLEAVFLPIGKISHLYPYSMPLTWQSPFGNDPVRII